MCSSRSSRTPCRCSLIIGKDAYSTVSTCCSVGHHGFISVLPNFLPPPAQSSRISLSQLNTPPPPWSISYSSTVRQSTSRPDTWRSLGVPAPPPAKGHDPASLNITTNASRLTPHLHHKTMLTTASKSAQPPPLHWAGGGISS
jgi:hypothetical protein